MEVSAMGCSRALRRGVTWALSLPTREQPAVVHSRVEWRGQRVDVPRAEPGNALMSLNMSSNLWIMFNRWKKVSYTNILKNQLSFYLLFISQTHVLPAAGLFGSVQLWWCVPAHCHFRHTQPCRQHHHHPQRHWGRGRQEVSSWKVWSLLHPN